VTSTIKHALVLTAGLGTRLRPLTLVRAKAAIPLAGDPLVRHIVRWLAGAGVTDLVLNLHYKPETITRVLGEGADLGVSVRYSWEQPEVLGSAGGPRLAAPLIDADPFLIVNGDTLTDLDLGAFTAAHATSGALVTMALVPNVEPHRYGGVRLDAAGAVVGFVPAGPSVAGSYHYIGVQAAAARAFDSVTPGTVAKSVGGVYDRLIAEQPGCIRGFVSDAKFWDIGTVADYWRTSWELTGRDTLGRGRDVDMAGTATVRHSILWDGVSIGAGANIEDCIVTDNVRVPAGARYAGAILIADGEDLIVTRQPPAPSP
jgi:NDP-sugar pyrophosphorylase family protein